MSHQATIEFLEKVYDQYQKEYYEWCEQNGLKADPSHFTVWLEDNDLIPEVEDGE